ncbi:ribulose-phosphate 3-epimerase [Candidatus Dependentiae bacterium]|nr:ribulose-phosphate 3-epimerase [Candidatus Dependentiae bacterium]
MEILPSLISADLLNLETVIKNLDPHCDGYHIDVMDDHFVPNLTWGPAFVKSISSATNLPLHVHLMVQNPEKWVSRIEFKSQDTFIFHYEATKSEDRILKLINVVKALGCKVGIAINPGTPVVKIFDYIDNIDHVLIMSVEPGFSGQKFIPDVVDKVKLLINQRNSMHLNFKIGMDGGIGKDNIAMLKHQGVDQFGIASAIFSEKDPVAALKNLYQ